MTEIRLARPEEIEVVLTLWRDATDVRATDIADALAQVVEREALIVALEDEQIVGSIVAGWDGWRGNIYRLAVAPSHRRRGIATALMSEAVRILKDRGARRLSILVNFDDAAATSYWQSLDGVRLDARVARYIKDL